MTATLTPEGPFSLEAALRFLEGFTPASYDRADDDVLRLAFPADDGVSVIGCAVRQDRPRGPGSGTVRIDHTVHGEAGNPPEHDRRAVAQIARLLSLDVDASGLPALAERDPVVADLLADHPGLRPVCFASPYEAAAWAVIGQRTSMAGAAAVKSALAREHGLAVRVNGHRLAAFPLPDVLRRIDTVPGLSATKVERLHGLAEAARDGRLDAAALRALPAEQALARLRELPGIGPFSAELILIRGAGHPDVFPLAEPRLHRAMIDAYGLDPGTAPEDLAALAERWSPFRSWVSLLLRTRAQERAHRPDTGSARAPATDRR